MRWEDISRDFFTAPDDCFLWSGSCLAADEAVCMVKCKGNSTGRVVCLGPDFEDGDVGSLFCGAGADLEVEEAVGLEAFPLDLASGERTEGACLGELLLVTGDFLAPVLGEALLVET